MSEPAPDEPLITLLAKCEVSLEKLARIDHLICSICADGEDKPSDYQTLFLEAATRDQLFRLLSIEANLVRLLKIHGVDPALLLDAIQTN